MNKFKFSSLVLIPFFLNCNQVVDFKATAITANHVNPVKETIAEATNVVLQSTDNGKSWQDISRGLPDNMENYDFIANDKGLYIPTSTEMYYRVPNASTPNWNKELFRMKMGNIMACKSGLYDVKYEGGISHFTAETNTWSPIFATFPERMLRTIFETNSGAVLIGCDYGLFKSSNKGIVWKKVLDKGWVIKIVESEGVLIATSEKGIIRSTDDGESWEVVVSEGGVGIDVARIKGGFAAISYNTASDTRRVRTSYDNGKTWQPIDAGLPPHNLIANIIQVGGSFYCGHPKGIFKSVDKGKTWEMILPSIGEKVFNLSVLGNVIYAVPKNGGC
jgi:photosystem II stability/assembly factor-like uncharacterized protein